MGLDVTAYSEATLLPEHEFRPDECFEAGHVRAFAYAQFHQSMRGLEWDKSLSDYQGNADVFIGGREYLCGGKSEWLSIGYGGHRVFRKRLASDLLGVTAEAIWTDPDKFRWLPFFELIEFADNEGTIGPEAASDLAIDFRDFADRADAEWSKPDSTGWAERLHSLYIQWRQLFDLAAGGGLVNFH